MEKTILTEFSDETDLKNEFMTYLKTIEKMFIKTSTKLG